MGFHRCRLCRRVKAIRDDSTQCQFREVSKSMLWVPHRFHARIIVSLLRLSPGVSPLGAFGKLENRRSPANQEKQEMDECENKCADEIGAYARAQHLTCFETCFPLRCGRDVALRSQPMTWTARSTSSWRFLRRSKNRVAGGGRPTAAVRSLATPPEAMQHHAYQGLTDSRWLIRQSHTNILFPATRRFIDEFRAHRQQSQRSIQR